MYDDQDNKPTRSFDDIDNEVRGQKPPPAPKLAKPVRSFDDIDNEIRGAAPKAAAPAPSFSDTNPTAPIIERTPKGTPTYDEWRKSGSTDVPDTFRPDYSHWTNAEMPDKAGNMRSFPARELDPGPKDGAEQVDTWFDATKPYSSETMSYKPKGVAPKPRVVDPRARQAAQISRQINQQRDEATRLFKQADATPMERMGGNFSNTEALRAQAEGKLAGANELARRAQKTHGDLLEVGFGKDADPNSRREWAYAKPKAPKAMEESDALAIQAGNNRRFADPNGLNQALNVTPEAKARFDHQRKIEGIQQSSYPGLDPVARFGSRVWQGVNGEPAANMAEAYPPVIPGEEHINRIAQSGVKGAGQLVRGGATALPYAFPVVDMMSRGLTGKPLRAYTEGLGRPMEDAISRGAETILPENPANQSFLAKTERGAGSMIPAIGGALATGGGSLAAGALGALTNLGQVADERDQSKVPISDFRRVSSDALAIATGMTEALGIGKLLNRVGLSTPLAHRLAQMIEEGGQEYAQDYLNDINAKLVAAYDPQRQINDPLAAKRLEAAAIGAILGAGGEVADYAGGKVNDRIATSAIRAESAPMQGIQPTTLGPTQITPLSRATAAAQPATTIPAIDQTVPRNAVEPSVPPVAAESQSSAFPRLPEVEGVNSREANLFGLKSPVETKVNTALQTADKLLNSQSESDQRQGKRMLRQSLADIQKSEGYQAELGLPDDAPKPYTAVRQAIEDRLKPAPKVTEQAAPVPELPAAQTGNTGQRLIEQTRQKADDAINEGRYDDAVSELKAHQQALKDAKTAARKSPGMRTQIERQIGQVGNQIGEVRRMAREARKQANATTAGLPETRKKNAEILPSSQPVETAPLLRPEAVQNPSGGIPQMPEQTFSGRLDQGMRRDAAEQAKPQQGKATADLSPIEYLKRKTERQGFRVSDKGEARRLGSKEAGIIGLTNKKSKWSVHDAQVMLDEGGFTMPDGRAFTDESVTEHDVLTYLDDFGKEKPVNTGNLEQRLKDEEAEYWAKLEGEQQEPTKSFDQIDAEVRGDSDTAALRRSIARSEERGHVAPSPGMGLVSMSPYADLKARNAEAVDRLYEVGPATKEGREIVNGLRKFTQQNGIENRHLGNLINDVKNHQMDRAFWKEQGLSLDTVQDGADSETALKDRVREATAKLSDNQRTAIEREVAALDELFGDSDAMNLLDRITEGDNNAANEFKQKAGEYGLEADTVAELIGTRRNAGSVRQAEASKTVRQNARAEASPQESREARSATPDEFDLLNRNPATLTKDEFDEHLLAVEKLRNDEIRGIVKLPRDDRRQMYKHLRNLNDERKFRVQQKELPAKYKKLPVPTMEERRAQWAAEESQRGKTELRQPEGKASESKSQQTVEGLREQLLKAETPDSLMALMEANNDYIGKLEPRKRSWLIEAADIRGNELTKNEKKTARSKKASEPAPIKTGDSVTWQSNGQTFSGKVTNVNGVIVSAQTADEKTSISRDKSKFTAAPRINERKDSAPTAADAISDAKIQFKSGKRGQAGTLYANDMALHVIRAAYEQSHGEQAFFENVNMNKSAARKIAAALTAEAQGGNWPADMQRSLRRTAREFGQAARSGETVSIVKTGDGRSFGDIKTSRRHELFHDAQEGLENSKGFLVRHEHGQKAIDSLAEMGYEPEDRTVEAAAFVASGEAGRLGLTDEQGKVFLKDYFDDIVATNGREALERFVSLSPKVQGALKEVRTQNDIQGKTGKVAEGKSESAETGRLGANGEAARSGERVPGAVREQKRSSFGELENEPKGQVLASGFNVQNLFNRKPKTPQAQRPIPLPKDFDAQAWARKTYTDAIVNAMSPADRAKYDAAKGEKAKIAAMLGAKVDQKVKDAAFDAIDKGVTAAKKGDGSGLYDAMVESAKLSAKKPPQGKFDRAKYEASNLVSLPRAVMASADISAPLRQGAILTLPPSQWGKATKATVRMFQSFSTKQYDKISKEINLHPDGQAARDAGLYLSTDKTGIGQKEEDFISNWSDKIPIVKHSEQAYKAYLDSLRMDTFARYKKSIDKSKGLSGEQKATAYKAAADWINVATGRGTLGKTFESAMPVLSKVMFAPRYTASRFQVLNPMTYAKNARTAEGRAVLKNQMGDMIQYAGMVSLTLGLAAAAGATVGLDPDDADFLKIKFGNIRYDTLAGLQQPMRLFYRLGDAVRRRFTGEKSKSNQTAVDIAERFGRSKMAPVPSFIWDAAEGKTFIGEKFEVGKGIIERVTPLMWRDFYDAYQKEGLGTALKALPGLAGIGVQNYGEKTGTLKPSKFTSEAEKTGHKYDFLKQKPGEPEFVYKQRKSRVEGWMDTYGQKLIDDPRYQSLSPDMQEAAIQNLRKRIGRQQNIAQPKMRNGQIESFAPGKVLEGVQKSTREKPKRDAKKLWVAPPR